MFLTVLLGTIGLLGKWCYGKYVIEDKEFNLNRLSITTDGVLTESSIAEVAEVSTGMDLLALDLEAVRSRLERMAIVVSATVTRDLPDRLTIRVRERVPVAWLSCPPHGVKALSQENGFLVDRNAHVFRCLRMDERVTGLPVIEARQIARPTEGCQLDSRPVRKALELLAKSEAELAGCGMEISEVNLTSDWAMHCVFRDGMRATFSLYEVDRGVKDLWKIWQRVGGRVKIASVDLTVEKNIPVVFAEEVDKDQLEVEFSAKPANSDTYQFVNPEEERKKNQLRSILRGG